MNEQNPMQADDLPLTDELVASYLEDNPEFFSRNPHLVTGLRLQDSQRGTVSLVERQQQQLRQKVQGLEEEITHLMSVANHNENLFKLYSDLYLQLIDSEDSTQLLDIIQRATLELLSLSALKLWLVPEFSIAHDCITSNDCQTIVDTRLAKEDYYFGRLQQSDQQQIFGDVNTGSVVLIKLAHHEQLIGFMAISSSDADHFDPRMDTLLLSQFQKLVAKLLSQHLAK
ncbi:DUF484 family protein [Thalassotalea sp. M1531]|uniref:DUF484 family protein n=1 Tax=Thalassotalea algicola TaxID=2716224 RepID=A0A7Y0LAK3_9GAMM|nr:DUF484 family protein [Thalassotalea algicola]NMP30719.1 DUF484 family protein [Thalassotalea algicola]